MQKILIIITITFSLSGCKENIESTIEGTWLIDTIYYKDFDIKNCLMHNALILNQSGNSVFPIVENNCPEVIRNSIDGNGYWLFFVSKNLNDPMPFEIKIISKNEIFNGTHKVVFHSENDKKLLKMEIFSDSLYLICSKVMYNIDHHINTVNYLKKASWTIRPD